MPTRRDILRARVRDAALDVLAVVETYVFARSEEDKRAALLRLRATFVWYRSLRDRRRTDFEDETPTDPRKEHP